MDDLLIEIRDLLKTALALLAIIILALGFIIGSVVVSKAASLSCFECHETFYGVEEDGYCERLVFQDLITGVYTTTSPIHTFTMSQHKPIATFSDTKDLTFYHENKEILSLNMDKDLDLLSKEDIKTVLLLTIHVFVFSYDMRQEKLKELLKQNKIKEIGDRLKEARSVAGTIFYE